MSSKDETFLGWIQLHERAWGTENYKDRPSLRDMLDAPVLAFWYPARTKSNPRYTATIHQSLKGLHEYATYLLLHSSVRQPEARLARLFVDKRKVRIRGVRVLIEEAME
jgi:hypothetical protein